MIPQPIKLRGDIELTCYTLARIDAIKKALSFAMPLWRSRAMKQSHNAKLIGPPLYVFRTNSTVSRYCFWRLLQYNQIYPKYRESQGGVEMKVIFLLCQDFFVYFALNYFPSPRVFRRHVSPGNWWLTELEPQHQPGYSQWIIIWWVAHGTIPQIDSWANELVRTVQA